MSRTILNRELAEQVFVEIVNDHIEYFAAKCIECPPGKLPAWEEYMEILASEVSRSNDLLDLMERGPQDLLRFLRGSGLVTPAEFKQLLDGEWLKIDWTIQLDQLADKAVEVMVTALQMGLYDLGATPDKLDDYIHWCKAAEPDIASRKRAFEECVFGNAGLPKVEATTI